MSPEIRKNGILIANVPDKTGTYNTLTGGIIYVNTDLIDADAKKQKITLMSDEIGGERALGLTHQGIGNSNDRKRGDKKDPEISVSLLNKPVRITYNDLVSDNPYSETSEQNVWHREKRTVKNPYWVRNTALNTKATQRPTLARRVCG